MNELQIFNNPQFGEVRVVQKDGEPWFVAVDVCRVLEIRNPSDTLKRLDDDERARFNLGHPMNETNCVNEFGLYSLVLGSRKKEARAFKRWITHDVIPSIRKTGSYAMPGAVQVLAKSRPEVSLVGLARVAATARRAVLDMGGTKYEAGVEVLNILEYCGLPVPDFTKRKKIFVELSDFF